MDPGDVIAGMRPMRHRLAGLAIDRGDDDAPQLVESLSQMASHSGMRELVVRADIHRARLGVPGAADSARLLAAEIDNPQLHASLDDAIQS
jgi:hypothetical protein